MAYKLTDKMKANLVGSLARMVEFADKRQVLDFKVFAEMHLGFVQDFYNDVLETRISLTQDTDRIHPALSADDIYKISGALTGYIVYALEHKPKEVEKLRKLRDRFDRYAKHF